MMSNNKILTVSYGTFSCTLEGFDDSFGTMKAIAEYFRDLAADDRYFGAEPPQPDAEMLARIAQKEISRRVEAHERDGKIVLSALEDQRTAPEPETPASAAAAPVAAAAVAAAAAPAPEAPTAEAPTAEEAAPVVQAPVEDTVGAETVEEAAPEELAADSPAEDADDAALTETVSAAAADAEETPAGMEDAVDDAVAAAVADTDAFETPEAPAMELTDDAAEDGVDIVPGQPDAEVEAFFADSPSAGLEDDSADEDAEASTPLTLVSSTQEPVDAPAPAGVDSIAAKLERIRAVVAQQGDSDEDDDYLEDEHADGAASDAPMPMMADEDDDAADAPANVVADARADIEDALMADDMNEAGAQPEDAADDADDTLTAVLSSLDTPAEENGDAADAVADTSTADAETDTDAAVANLFGDASADAETEAQPEAADEAPRARVIKVKRADLEAAIRQGDLEEYDTDASDDSDAPSGEKPMPRLDDVAPARTPTSSLSPEDEADLVRELAALESDMQDGADSALPEAEDMAAEEVDTVFDAAEPAEVQEMDGTAEEVTQAEDATDTPDAEAPASRSVLPSIDDGDGADMNRLLAEADSQMDEPESATRRDAFAHLRAAVAARKADGTMDAEEDAKKDANAYRSDLADVVRPRRPEAPAEGQRTARPGEGRPAPLKLVAEQRVDLEQPKSDGPVRPRRVSAVADTAPVVEGESFAQYAEDLGATKLPELLEAAASYMSFVEGREEFSRPQLMTKVRQAGPSGEFSREDGLRSFGQLLRSGKIEKIKGGRFTVSDDIGYRPDERAAG